MSTQEEALSLVEQLNEKASNKGNLDYYCPFEFKSTGWSNSVIYFMGVHVWDDCDDMREYVDECSNERESLENYVLKMSKIIFNDLKIKMKVFK